MCGQKSGGPSQGAAFTDSLSHRLVLAHMVNLDNDVDLPLLSSTQTAVAHNPSSNLKLASGIAAVPEMMSESFNINISLGTDGGPCSNHYDLLQEAHLASILQKGVHHNASLIPAEAALEMATINGARALGLENDIGSLEVGKKADLVVLDPYGHGGLAAAPWDPDDDIGMTPVTAVIHSCTGRDVDMTVVDGKVMLENGVLVPGGRAKEMEIVSSAQQTMKRLVQRCNETGQGNSQIQGKLAPGWKYV